MRTGDTVDRVRAHLRTPLFANAYFLLGRTAVNAVSGFLFWWLAAVFYEKTEVGLAAAIIAAAGLITSFSTLGLGFGIIRFLPGAAEKSVKLINYSLTLSGSVGISLAMVFVLGVGLWSPALLILRHQMPFFVSFALLVTASSIIPLLDRTFMAERSARYAFVMTIIVAALKVAFLVSFFFAASSFAIVGAMAMATVLTVIVSLFILLPKSHGSYKPSFVARMVGGSEMLRYSIGSYGADLLASVPGLVLPLIVVNVLGEAANADFYIAWMIAGLIVAIPFAVTTSLFVEGSHDDSLFNANAKRSLKLSFGLIIPALIFIFLFGRFVLSLFGSDYSNATTLLKLLASSAIFTTFIMVYLTQKRIMKDIKSLAILSSILLVLQVGLSYMFMGPLGIEGIGLGVLIAQAIVAAPIIVKWGKPYLLGLLKH